MRGSNVLMWSVLAVLLATCAADLIVTEDGDQLTVTYHDVLLFKHTPVSPLFTVGEGNAIFEESTGNFEITEESISSQDLIEIVSVISDSGAASIVFSTGQITSNITVQLDLVVVSSLQKEVLTINVEAAVPEDSTLNRLWCRFSATEDEKVFGAGEQFTYFNLRGHNFPIWTREQGVGRDGGLISIGADADGNAGGSYDTTYWPQASYMSCKKYSLFIENYDYLEMNFESPTTHDIFVHSLQMTAKLYWASTIEKLIPFVGSMLGTQKPIPDWILSGSMLGVQGGTDQMLEYYELAKDAGVNVSALWIQDWSGKVDTSFGYRVYWNWKWNETMYPELDEKIQELDAEGVKVGVYCNPHLIVDSELYLEAESLGYLMTDKDGNTYDQDFRGFYAGTVDIFNKDAKNWYKDVLTENIVDLGLAHWMADFAEYTRLDMYSKDTSLTQEQIHNTLPVRWAELNRDLVDDSGTSDTSVYFMRSGALGSSANQVLAWAGDQNTDFSMGDGVASTVVAALSLSVSGMGITHFDIGGYTGVNRILERSEELFLRSAEYAVFTPVMRTHEGNLPDNNVQFYSSEEILLSFARLTQIHSALFPYTKSLVNDNSQLGMPIQRPMFLHYEEDTAAWDIMYQYMYGPDLIVAPIIHKNQMEVDIYIPEGDDAQWYHLFTNEGPYVGPMTLTVSTPMGSPAVLYRADSDYQPLFQQITQTYGVTGNKK